MFICFRIDKRQHDKMKYNMKSSIPSDVMMFTIHNTFVSKAVREVKYMLENWSDLEGRMSSAATSYLFVVAMLRDVLGRGYIQSVLQLKTHKAVTKRS